MSEETLIPIDPLADEGDDDILPPPVEEVVETETVEVIEEPVAEVRVDNSRPVFNPIDPEDEAAIAPSTQFLPNGLATLEEMQAVLERCLSLLVNQHGTLDNVPGVQDILDAFKFLAVNQYGDKYHEFFEKNAGKLAQYVIGEQGKKIRINHPEYPTNGDVLTGLNAARYIKRHSGSGKTTRIPLWHSGIILIIPPMSIKEQADLISEIQAQTSSIGKKTNGASYSGDDVIVTGILLEHILSKVTDSNLKDSRMDFGKIIDVTDIPFIMAGALEAIYPNGYPVFHVCVNNNSKGGCNYVITAKKKEDGDYYPDSLINFAEVSRINESYLTEADKVHMSAAPNTHTLEQVRAYKERLAEASRNKIPERSAVVIKVPEGKDGVEVTVHFKVPSIEEYNRCSLEWIESVKTMAETALNYSDSDVSARAKEDKRIEHINKYSRITNLVKHLGWIDYFSTKRITKHGVEEFRIIDAAGKRKTLETLVETTGSIELFEKAISEYKVNCIIGTTGIPNFECPSCKSGQTEPGARWPSLIPINLSGYFFSTMSWKIAAFNLQD